MKVARVRRGPQPRLTSPFGVGGTLPMPALDDLSDVDLTGLADGDTIVFDDGTDTWVPGSGSISSSNGGGFDVTPPLSNALPPWVKPTGSGVITNDAQGRLTIDSGSTYKAFMGMTFLEGRLHLVYRDGSAHNSAGGTVKYRTSDDLGRTWSSTTTLATGAGSNDVRDPAIVALSSGRLLVVYDTRNPYNSTNILPVAIYSDNRGQSWSSPYSIPTSATGTAYAYGTSQPLELPDGTILVPGTIADGSDGDAVIWKSTDGGLTFPTEIAVASTTRDYLELQIRLLASGKIVGLMRSESNEHRYRTVSTDAGATWSSPTDVLTITGRPDFVEFFPGALITFGRSASPDYAARWAVSWDEGATWTSLQQVDTGSTDEQEYAAPVVLTPGYIAVAYSIENSSSDADLYLRYYHDGYGTDPLGNIVGLSVTPGGSFATPAIVLGTAAAAGAASTAIRSDSTIVAFDSTAPANVANVGVASSTGSVALAARRDHAHALTYHDEPLTDGASNFIFDGGDIVVVTGVPN